MNIISSTGFVITLIVIFGYTSNWLNWRLLNYKITHFLYYIGAFVHESSHAFMCILTGAKIQEFKVLSTQPQVTHGRSKIPFIGGALISTAPIFGGLIFLFIVNRYILGGHFSIIQSDVTWNTAVFTFINLITEIKIWEWQSWVMILLLINAGAMIGPSIKDAKNIWPVIIILFFVHSAFITSLGLAALFLIFVNIIIQIFLALFIWIF